jgi:AhpD family alkylhydroperoxidase
MSGSDRELAEKVIKERGFFSRTREIWIEHDPRSLEIFNETFRHVMLERNALSYLTKELMIVAIDALQGHHTGLRIHMKSALKAGATPDQLFESLLVASLPGGIHALTTSVEVFQEVVDEYNAKKPDLSDWPGSISNPPGTTAV